MKMLRVWLGVITAYLLGSIPSAYIVGRLAAGIDIRQVGDGNMGAKNVYHHLGLAAGALVALADIGKGIAAMLVAQALALSETAILVVGLAVVMGHDWPLFLRFRGGQGQATSMGVLLVLLPQQTIIVLIVVGVMLLITHHWEISNGVGLALFPLLAWWSGKPPQLVLYPVVLLPTIGIKKLIDLPRAKRLAAMRGKGGEG